MKKEKIIEENAANRSADEQVTDILTLRRTAKEARRYKIIMRVVGVLVVVLVALVAAEYAVSYFYDQFGSFTVPISLHCR